MPFKTGSLLLGTLGALALCLPAFGDPPASATYTYDDAGRLKQATHDNGAAVEYQLDPAGNRNQVVLVQATPRLELVSASYAAGEEAGSIAISVRRTGGATGAVSVGYSTSDGTAAAPADYTSASGTLNWADGVSGEKSFSVSIGNDASYESSEQFTIAIANPGGGAVLGTSTQSTVTVTDNDAAPSFAINDVSVAESSGLLTFTVTKSGSTALSHPVNFATANGSALAGSDYTGTSGTLNFAAGDATQTFAVTITDDVAYEGSESFTATLSSPTNGAAIADSSGTGTISENDAAPSFTIDDVSVAENAGSATFTVTKSGSTTLSHAVNYATANGSAAAGSDYTAGSGALTFAAGEVTKTFAITITNDTLYEGNESFTAALSAPTNGATIADSSGTGTISENDAAPSFTINDVSLAENGGSLTFSVTKSGGTALSHAVNYATANGSAAAGSDYTAASGTLTFAAGDATKTFAVAITDDSVYEGNESFAANLSSPTNGATIADSSGTGTISENDPQPFFGIAVVSEITEGQTVSFNVYKTGSTAFAHQVSYTTFNGTALAGSDYAAASGVFTFQPSDTNHFIVVATTDDSTSEATENFGASLSNATNGAYVHASAGSGTTQIVDNDNVPTTPANLRTSPVGVTYNGNYTVLWNASSGPVSYYRLQEDLGGNGGVDATFTINAPTTAKSFSKGTAHREFYYRVQACSATNQCSVLSNETTIMVCPASGCP